VSRPRLFDPGFLAFLRQQPCCVCGKDGSQAAHIRMGNPDYGKLPVGMQEKPSDRFATPLCGPDLMSNRPGCHARQHEVREIDFWMYHGLDPFKIAARLYEAYGGDGGRPKPHKAVKPRKPKAERARFPKGRGLQRRSKNV
jgi:hypothetical protein